MARRRPARSACSRRRFPDSRGRVAAEGFRQRHRPDRHPATGRKLIYVNRGFTARINELSKAESDALLAFLFEHCARPDFQMRFRWRAHSIAFWDNRASQHQAIWDYYPNVRSGYRIQIKGTAPPLPA